MTPALERALWEIVRCPLQGLPKRLSLEGKALEVLGMEQSMHGRSAIAHDTLKDPPSLILDEAISAVDNEAVRNYHA